MFFLYGSNSGSPILARKSAPLFTAILILGMIIILVVALGILIAKIREYKKSNKYIEKEKKGEVTMEDAKLFLDKKYKMKENVNA